MGHIEWAMIWGVSAFVVGLVATVLVSIPVAAGCTDTVGATVLAVSGVGALGGVIGRQPARARRRCWRVRSGSSSESCSFRAATPRHSARH